MFEGGHKTALGEHVSDRLPYLANVALTQRRIITNIGIINEPGHPEPWTIAISDTAGYLTTLDYSARWGIEPMFSDLKSRRFGLEQSQLRMPERLGRLLLVMSLALYFAVSNGIWNAATNPTVDEKKPQASTRQPEPQQAILVYPWRAPHCEASSVPPADSATLGVRMKLMCGNGHDRLLASGRGPWCSNS